MKGYIKIQRRDKKPVEAWRDIQYTREELDPWVQAGGNIGFATGTDDIVILDIDNPKRVDELGIRPFHTYAVRTGSGGYHLYYRVPRAKKVVLFDPEGLHLGELQCLGQYCVVPPSIHPNGNPYTVVDPSVPILEISQEELLEPFKALKTVCTAWKEIREPEIIKAAEFNIDDVWDLDRRQRVEYGYIMSHPIHGSETGHNCVVDFNYKWFRCFRCQATGNAVKALALREGIIHSCSDELDKNKFIETMRTAERLGLVKPRRGNQFSVEGYKPRGGFDD
jgi:hypothetical protein